MLCELQIENVAVIEKAVVSFEKRFNVLTGETGAGKSILIDSINAILGNRANREIVRSGTEKASILAVFDNIPASIQSSLTKQGYESSDNLILSREVFAEGRSICRINGKPATASTVRDLCQNLVNIHGQLDNQELLDPEKHLFILDRYASLEQIMNQYQVEFDSLIQIQKRIKQLQIDEFEKTNRIDLLKYQINEIDNASLKPSEEEELTSNRNIMKNAERITSALHMASELLSNENNIGEGSSLDQILSATNELEHLSSISNELNAISTRLSDAYFELKDINETIQATMSSIDYDPNELNNIEERLDLIFRLKKKYGDNISAILQYRDEASAQLKDIEMSDELLEELKSQFKEQKRKTIKLAQDLSQKRLDAFLSFSQQIRNELSYLNMPDVDLQLHHEVTKELTPTGMDQIEFLISTNPGEVPKALSKIASGGEMARIMLAIKNVMAEKDNIPTLIFDEIDTGVSGKSAQKIGVKLKEISSSHQVICVTHSAQVAAFAQNHLKIEKTVSDGRTFTSINKLSKEDRIKELARIISGDNVTSISLKNAEEMLSLAEC